MNLGEISKRMQNLNNWFLEGESIQKVFNFRDFKDALEFANKVGEIAEKRQHHPDMLIEYNKVKLTLTTHSKKSLTEKDFEIAEEIDSMQEKD